MIWKIKPGHDIDELGLIPSFLNEDDPRPAAQQIDAHYGHGGGWQPFKGHTMLPDGRLKYPEDPPLDWIGETKLRDEVIRMYQYAWVVIIQPDGSFEVSRID